ncbi:MAG: DUF6326 family protein [Nocardioides sp.]
MSTTTLPQYRDTPVDVRVRLSALWIAMLFLFAYVDIFGFFRADVLEAALDGTVGTTGLAVDQTFLTLTLVYITLPTLMVVLTLVLRPRANRVVNLIVSPLYVLSIGVSCVGETWVYYLLGSAVEVVLLGVIAWSAWTWPAAQTTSLPGDARTAARSTG